MLSMLCLTGFEGCPKKPDPVTVERAVTSKDCRRALLEEHEALFAENIRLKAALKLCQEKPLSNP
jgi:hypothetical protein